ncbi:ATP-binding protein [Cryptosporangium japonicum]|uniref:ATP-binding protein n=1 Tax=Cryptosporangium japonicum TaxID=80872 RepID=A0ABP3EUD6_9ACTN
MTAAPEIAGVERETLPWVGRVLGTEDATPLQFHVALRDDAYLQLDDVVVTVRDVPGLGPVLTAGVVTQVTARHEGAQFSSDVFLIADGVLPAQVQEVAEIATTRVEPEVYVPPRPGEPVRRATGEERAIALYFDRMERKVPVGLGRDGTPIYVNLDFLDGTRGAHISISGVSGVATKTSFALFLLYGLFRSGALGRRTVNTKALIFSVKGEDLLFLDHTNTKLDETLRRQYAIMGLPAEPFASTGFYAPPLPGDLTGRPDVRERATGVHAFWWTLHEFCRDELLPYVFADAEDERNQYTMVVHQVAARLRMDAVPAGTDGAIAVDGRQVRTYDQLVDLISDKLSDDNTRSAWAGQVTGIGTVNAFLRRLRSSLRALRPLIRGDLPDQGSRRVSTENQQLTVVDLHNLPERAQRFVVGVVLAAETRRKEEAGAGGLLFTMLDELNKYAPREGSSPIKEVLLDIAERGRSLGIILIGAQQTASEVERRIISNSSIKVVGRLDPAEAGRPEYGFLPPGQRQRVTLAKPGTMFVAQPEIPVPLAVEFPFPAWATRSSEAGEAAVTGPPPGVNPVTGEIIGGRDPFKRLPSAPADDAPF